MRRFLFLSLMSVCISWSLSGGTVLGRGDHRVSPEKCTADCEAAAKLVKKMCLRRGGGEERCQAVADDALAGCQRFCDRIPPDRPPGEPPPDRPSCAEACQARAAQVKESCLAMGTDAEECGRVAAAHLEMCLRRCEGGDDGGDHDRPRPTCPERCEALAERTAAACGERGGSEEECAAKVAMVKEHCRRGCERVPPRPCPERCAHAARGQLAECLGAGGDAAECEAAAAAARDTCVAHCEGDTRPEPPACEERCEQMVERGLMACLDEGDPEDECREKAAARLERCLQRCEGPPDPPDCADRCAEARERVLQKCIDRGGDPDRCAVLADRVGGECRRHCRGHHPRNCRRRCEHGVRVLRRSCEARDLSEEECDERIATFLEHCKRGCDRPADPPTCEERCERHAAATNDSCLEGGGTEQECAAAAEEARAACLDRCENPPEPPSCDERCGNRAEGVFAACLEENGAEAEAECREKADAFLDVCLTRCSRERPMRCGQRCAQVVREALSRCLEHDDPDGDGGDPGDDPDGGAGVDGGDGDDGGDDDASGQGGCRRRAARALARCLRGHCGDRPPHDEPRPPCGERCAAGAERLAGACAERGGTEEECAELVARFNDRCLAHCDDGDDGGDDGGDAGGGAAVEFTISESLCMERGNELEVDCLSGGGIAGDCNLQRLGFEETCFVELAGIDDWLDLMAIAPPQPFLRGDSNRDERVDMGDAVNTLSSIFLAQGNAFDVDCQDRTDANDDGGTDISDPVYTLVWLFLGGPAPPAPGPLEAGHDPTFDSNICFE